MSDDEIRDGDVVRLKSGGPSLTVIGVTADGLAVVTWFDEDGTIRECCFHTRYLEPSHPGD